MSRELDENEFGTYSVKLNRSTAPLISAYRPSVHRSKKKWFKYSCKLPILLPFGRFKSIWNIFLFFILVYSVVQMPYAISFNSDEYLSSINSATSIIGLFTDFCLMIDILLNFRTA
eukprot:317044_1